MNLRVAVLVILALSRSSEAHAAGKGVEGVVNLNTAPPELLSLLPGIGPSKARGIVSYRTRHLFHTVDELVRVKGIGRRMVRAMRSHLAISGPSTARGTEGREAIVPAPPVTPAPPLRAACRPMGAIIAHPSPPRRSMRGAQDHPIRSPANHCAPPE